MSHSPQRSELCSQDERCTCGHGPNPQFRSMMLYSHISYSDFLTEHSNHIAQEELSLRSEGSSLERRGSL